VADDGTADLGDLLMRAARSADSAELFTRLPAPERAELARLLRELAD
jgi:hypothetical protein